jgi:NodT family efflux transporter outer membrane factor (OMF) lipoprotein
MRLAVLSLSLLFAGCSLAPDPEPPVPVEEIPEQYEEISGAPDGGYSPTRWWTSFSEPALDRLVDTVLAANLDLTEAVARVLESQAQLGIASADLLPSVNGSVDVSRSSSPTNSGFGRQIASIIGGAADTTGGASPAPAPPDRIETTSYSASAALSYEVDFWGRARNDRGAALRELEASQADLQAVTLGVLSETITAYFDVAELRRRVALTEEVEAVLEERVALTESRYDRGLVTSLELYQIRQDLRNAQAGIPQLRTQLKEAEGRLAVLAGRYPAQLEPLLRDPGLPTEVLPPVPAALPPDLLWQRPDVRAAGQRLEAARLRVGARRAELLPRLTLSATMGLESSQADEWLDLGQWFRNLAAGLTAPLFQGGRLRANVQAARARLDQQTAAYGRAVLTAYVEVENALVRLREEEARLAFFRSQLDEAESSLNLQESRYRSGVSGYTDFLDALRNRLTVENALASAARDYALARLSVHRALGGDWVDPRRDGSESPDAPLP